MHAEKATCKKLAFSVSTLLNFKNGCLHFYREVMHAEVSYLSRYMKVAAGKQAGGLPMIPCGTEAEMLTS